MRATGRINQDKNVLIACMNVGGCLYFCDFSGRAAMYRLLPVLILSLAGIGFFVAPVWADINSGLSAYASGDFDTAAREFALLAGKGDKEGQYHLGLLYEEGQGVPKSYSEAVNYYTKAANQGYVDAYFALGEIFLRQPGGKRDRVTADYWLGMAARHGHPRGPDEYKRNRNAMTPEQLGIVDKKTIAH